MGFRHWSGVGLALGAWLVACAAPVLGADPSYYVRKETWQDTMLASREALAKEQAEAAKRGAEAPKPGVPQLGTWYQIGPFYPKDPAERFTAVHPPEKEIALEKAYGDCRWTRRPEYEDGVVHTLSAGTNGATYLYRTITVAGPAVAKAYFGSDDGLVVWLNGKKLISNDVPRGPGPNQDSANLALEKGENRLLLRIQNNSGGHGFYFSLSDKPAEGGPAAPLHEALWQLVGRDFGGDAAAAREMAREREDAIWTGDWQPGDLRAIADRYVQATRVGTLAAQAKAAAAAVKDAAGLRQVRALYAQAREIDAARSLASNFNFEALRRAVLDLVETYGAKYPKGAEYLARLEALEKQVIGVVKAAGGDGKGAADRLTSVTKDLEALRREALLANPVLDFQKVLLVKRSPKKLGLPQNWQGNSTIGARGYDNEIDVLSLREGKLERLYRPEGDGFVGDLELHWDGDRFLFSMPGTHGKFQVFEMRTDGTGLRQVTPGDQPDVDNYDACYLPDGRVIFCSTACYLGVPCVGGGDYVGSLYLLEKDGKTIRQLTYDQDHSWCPTVLGNGRVIYTRWEYSDTPHYFSRLLFQMNPDGTAQFEHYGSNSYWPNSMFYARPMPGHPTQVAAIVSGHHGVPRMGELVILDPAKGQREGNGVVQRIPGYRKVVDPVIRDGLVDGSWPKFLHPYPLSEKYLLVSCQMTEKSPWAVYLVDVFDNMLCLSEDPAWALLEPTPLGKSPTPPAIPDKIDLKRKDAVVYLVDVYRGDGLKGVPRGSVKRLRIYSNHYGYRGMGGHINIGIDGPWDVKRILGTVPVNEDGSAMFRVPANTPIVVEPLDAEGKALQVMRSWYTAMPGEFASCVGCHEPQHASPPPRLAMATGRKPSDIEPWYGSARGFSFEREIQKPVLAKYCVGCHNGKDRPDGKKIPDFRAKEEVAGYKGGFTPAYEALHPYVRRPGPESDYHLPMAAEYHADVSELVQTLKKGHHGVRPDAEAWDRLVTWIDLNVPCHGIWAEHSGGAIKAGARALELAKLYGGPDVNMEAYPEMPERKIAPVAPAPEPAPAQAVACPNWPFDAAEAKKRQEAGGPATRTVDLPGGLKLDLVRIPAGEFVMGDPDGAPDERPPARVRIAKPFWMAKFEVTNEQFALFNPAHDSGYISWYNKDQDQRGEQANRPRQPVIRVPWHEATAFCRWLTQATGERFTLPTEAEWEYACRAGTATPMNYGAADADFAKFANLADERLNNLTRRDSPRWIPTVGTVNDGDIATAQVDRHQPNAWGLHDMHGNVAEWTRTAYAPYPYQADDGRDSETPEGRKVARGGSFYDRPKRARSGFRLSYPAWQGVYNVGLRVVSTGERVAPPVAASK